MSPMFATELAHDHHRRLLAEASSRALVRSAGIATRATLPECRDHSLRHAAATALRWFADVVDRRTARRTIWA